MVSFTPVLTIDEVVKIESKSRTVKTIRQGGEKKKEKKKKTVNMFDILQGTEPSLA